MGLSEELAFTTATALAARIRSRELSPVEVMDATLERIEERNPSLNAIVFQAFDEARAAAAQAERDVASREPLGPLHGVPTAMKDLYDFKPGWPATIGGIPALRDQKLPISCVWVERMERAGAIVVGKTNAPSLGMRLITDNRLFGPTRNPYDTTRNAGGSSGGAGAAVGDGLVTFAEGSDAGGSTRIPAAWCGAVGFKSSWGRTPFVLRPDAFGATAPFLNEGTITRNVADMALVMTAHAGPDPRDPFSARDEVDWLGAPARGIAGMRIAYSPDLDVFPIDRRVAAVVERAARAFEEAGAHVEQVRIGLERDQRELSDMWFRLIMPTTLGNLARWKELGIDLRGEHRDDLPPEAHHWFEIGDGLSALDVVRDQEMRTEVFDALQALMADYDLLVSPTAATLPVPNATAGITAGPTEIDGVAVDPLVGWCPTFLSSLTGHPAISVPAGLADGLPVGLHIVGRLGADADVLAAAAAFERVRPWDHEIPRLRPIP